MDRNALDPVFRLLAQQAKAQWDCAEFLSRAASALASAGRIKEAERLYSESLGLRPADPKSVRALTALIQQQGRGEEAFEVMLAALRRTPNAVLLHHDAGALLATGVGDASRYLAAWWSDLTGDSALGSIEEAERLGCQWLDGKGASAPQEAGLVLGHLLVAQQRPADAAEVYQRAAHAEAGRCRLAALRLAGLEGEVAAAEGREALAAGHGEAAVAAFRRALEAGCRGEDVYDWLAHALKAQHRYDEATRACRDGLRAHPGARALQRQWVWALNRDGRWEEAARRARAFVEQGVGDGYLDRFARLALPVVYTSEDEVAASRRAFASGLSDIEADVRARPATAERWAGLLRTENFFLPYQGEDDRSLQERYAAIVEHLAAALVPTPPPASRPVGGRRLRVGYASPFLHTHTVAKLFGGWITHLDRERFEVYAYKLSGYKDATTARLQGSADVFRTVPEQGSFVDFCADVAAQIVGDELDVLVYPSVGMHAATVTLASLRLAPVQAAAWGHPVTTGLTTVDYFLSSDLMEPDGAEAHYTERLVRLPDLGVTVSRPATAEVGRTRVHFGLSDDDVVFHSPQSVFKYLPRYDALYPAIARRVPNAVFTFIEDYSPHVTRLFLGRLEAAFEQAGLDPTRHLALQPRLSTAAFADLNRLADVYLDSPGWSGGMTTLDALATGLPAVTWPGPFMRGRHTAAFLQRLGLSHLIAINLDDYVEIAARLGTAPEERGGLRRAILARAGRLFDDRASVRALEAFYERAVAASSRGS